ncbi:MAG: FixH family protein, partial [Alphaproteobacteria bacterium]
FALIFLANGAFIWLALDTWSGLTSDESYAEGLAYNDTLRQAETQAALGWQVGTDVRPLDGGHMAIELELRDRDGSVLRGLTLEGRLTRPTAAGLDQALAFVAVGDGRWRAELVAPVAGQWDLEVEVARDDQVFRLRQRIMAP